MLLVAERPFMAAYSAHPSALQGLKSLRLKRRNQTSLNAALKSGSSTVPLPISATLRLPLLHSLRWQSGHLWPRYNAHPLALQGLKSLGLKPRKIKCLQRGFKKPICHGAAGPRSATLRYHHSTPFAGMASPKSFITICKSFQVSFFCRGSRSKNAG